MNGAGEIYCLGLLYLYRQGWLLLPLSSASCFCTSLCGPGPVQLLFLLPSGKDWSGSHWASSLHPARPVGLGPKLCLHNTYFTFSKGGPGPPSIRSSNMLVKKMQISGSCPGLQDRNPWGQWPESTI